MERGSGEGEKIRRRWKKKQEKDEEGFLPTSVAQNCRGKIAVWCDPKNFKGIYLKPKQKFAAFK